MVPVEHQPRAGYGWGVNPLLAVGVLVASVAVMVSIMLFARRHAPPGSRVGDSDRSSGVFGFLGAGFVILLGFVIFLSFGTYDNARTQSEVEATAVIDQFAAAEVMPPALRAKAQAQLVCYGRSVVHLEWPAMANGQTSPVTDGWADDLEQSGKSLPGMSGAEDAGLADWYSAEHDREMGRRARLLVAQGEIPLLLWSLIIIGAVLVVGYVLLYADPDEEVTVQVAMAGGVTALVVASLLAVVVLASPFQNENGSIEPVGMQYSLDTLKVDLAKDGTVLPVLCDARGVPLR
jgi:hypothetical protein